MHRHDHHNCAWCDCHKATTCPSQLTPIFLGRWSVVCKTGGEGSQVTLLGEWHEQALSIPSPVGTDVYGATDGTSGADDGDRWPYAWTHKSNAATTANADAAAATATAKPSTTADGASGTSGADHGDR